MPSSTAFWTAGPMADESCARTISTLAPCEIRLSMSVNCFCADDCASAEIYLSPAAVIAAFIAASSVFHRSSWKFDQETPITLPLASAKTTKQNDNAAPASKVVANLPMMTLPAPGAAFAPGPADMEAFFELRKNACLSFVLVCKPHRRSWGGTAQDGWLWRHKAKRVEITIVDATISKPGCFQISV